MSDIECIRNQNDEFKALQCIYLEQFHTVRDTNPQKFTIECQPYSGNPDQYKIKLQFQFTSSYPTTPPKYELEPITGITRDNMNAIIGTIEEIIHSNDGKNRPIIYEIVEETRVWIQEYLVEGKAYMKDEQQFMKKREEIFEKPKFATYTPVTLESFTAWKKDFDARNKLKKIEKKETEVKVSGKKWFLGKKEEEIDQEDEEDEDQDEQQDEQEDEKVEIPQDDVEMNDLFKTE